jgi:hypothetical protein
MLSFKREGDGTWRYGQRKTVVEDGSRWAVNPTTFRRGHICFSATNKVLGERLAPVNLPMPDPSELPDKGAPWVEEWGVNLRCLDGADAGLEVTYKATTVGGVQAIAGLIDEVRNRLNGKTHGGAVSPIVHLNKYDYTNSYGKIWNPLLDVVAWMSMDGPAPAPTPPPSSPSSPPSAAAAAAATEQPRRRRVG